MKGNKVYIDTVEAREMVKEKFLLDKSPTLPTIISWIKEYDLGYKFVGRWKIDKEKFMKFLIDSDKIKKK